MAHLLKNDRVLAYFIVNHVCSYTNDLMLGLKINIAKGPHLGRYFSIRLVHLS